MLAVPALTTMRGMRLGTLTSSSPQAQKLKSPGDRNNTSSPHRSSVVFDSLIPLFLVLRVLTSSHRLKPTRNETQTSRLCLLWAPRHSAPDGCSGRSRGRRTRTRRPRAAGTVDRCGMGMAKETDV